MFDTMFESDKFFFGYIVMVIFCVFGLFVIPIYFGYVAHEQWLDEAVQPCKLKEVIALSKKYPEVKEKIREYYNDGIVSNREYDNLKIDIKYIKLRYDQNEVDKEIKAILVDGSPEYQIELPKPES